MITVEMFYVERYNCIIDIFVFVSSCGICMSTQECPIHYQVMNISMNIWYLICSQFIFVSLVVGIMSYCSLYIAYFSLNEWIQVSSVATKEGKRTHTHFSCIPTNVIYLVELLFPPMYDFKSNLRSYMNRKREYNYVTGVRPLQYFLQHSQLQKLIYI